MANLPPSYYRPHYSSPASPTSTSNLPGTPSNFTFYSSPNHGLPPPQQQLLLPGGSFGFNPPPPTFPSNYSYSGSVVYTTPSGYQTATSTHSYYVYSPPGYHNLRPTTATAIVHTPTQVLTPVNSHPVPPNPPTLLNPPTFSAPPQPLPHQAPPPAASSSSTPAVAAVDTNSSGGELKEGSECIICCEREAVMALVPCGHKRYCPGCVATLSSRTNSCPVCRQPFTSYLRIY